MSTPFLLLLLLSLTSSASCYCRVDSDFMDELKDWMLLESCWGKEAMDIWYSVSVEAATACGQREPLFDMEELMAVPEDESTRGGGSNRMPKGLPNEASSFVEEFLEELEQFKEEEFYKISNLSCIMTELELWTVDGDVNIAKFTDEIMGMENLSLDLRTRLSSAYQSCYDKTIPWRQMHLKPTLRRKLGRQMKFNRCLHKHERQICAQELLSQWVGSMFEQFDKSTVLALGLPKDRHEASCTYINVRRESMPETSKFALDELFRGGEN